MSDDEGSSASASRGETPERLGDYRILRVVGSGGMGIVYEAERESLASRVALKVIHPRSRADPNFLRRFRNEARAAAGLHHTNIVPVFDFGDHEGIAYYAMQYIEGRGLDRILVEARRLRRTRGTTASAVTPAGDPLGEDITRELLAGQFAAGVPGPGTTRTAMPGSASTVEFVLAAPACEGEIAGPPPRLLSCQPGSAYYREVARLVRQVAEALDYAHGRGVLHRDIKPSNLLLDLDGHVWITDFGLAKLEAGEDLTQSRDVAGTLRYMAPERYQGRSLRRGDVYALGATLYELLTSRPAFEAADPLALMHQIQHRPPTPPREIDRRIPRDLETIVLKAMAKEPTDRYETAAALAQDLRLFAEDRSIKARRSTLPERAWRWGRRNPAVAGLSAAVALILVAVVVGSTSAAIRFNRAAEENRRLLVRQYVDTGVRRLDEGDPLGSLPWFAEALRRDQADPARERAHRIRLAATLQACPRLVQIWHHDAGVTSVVYDDAGRRIVTASEDRSARVWDAAGGNLIASLPHDDAVRHASFSPGDGRRVVTASLDGTARVWDASTGEPITPPMASRLPLWHAAFSPDGRRVVTACDDGTARVWEADTGTPLTPPLDHGGVVRHAAFSPDGFRIATAGDDGTAQIRDFRPDARPVSDLVRMTRVLSGHRWHEAGGLMPIGPDELRHDWPWLRGRYPSPSHPAPETTHATTSPRP